MRNLIGAFASLACGLLVIGAIVGISAWSPWKSRAHAHELAWIERYAAWHAVIRRELREDQRIGVGPCRARFERRVGDAPASLVAVYRSARRSCAALRSLTLSTSGGRRNSR